jgi:hypothetical protein
VALVGRGALAMWWDADPDGEADMAEWHAREHFPERLGIPGFLRGRRFTSARHPSWFTLYETEDVEVLSSAAYLERLNNPTEWTRRSMKSFRNMTRTPCRVIATRGALDGGAMATLELSPGEGREEELQDWLAGTLLDELLARPGVVAAHFCRPDSAAVVETAEKKLRATPDRMAGWLLLIEAQEPAAAWEARAEVLEQPALTARGAAGGGLFGVYSLSFALSSSRTGSR